MKCNCQPVTACEVKTRTRYATRVVTSTTSGTFRLLGNLMCSYPDTLDVLPVETTPTPTNTEGGVTA